MCTDTPNAFPFLAVAKLPTDCTGGLALFGGSLGGVDALCRYTITEAVAAATSIGAQWVPPAGASVMAEVCPESCAAWGVPALGCMPPLPPFAPLVSTPPPLPPVGPTPGGSTMIRSTAALATAWGPGERADLYLDPGVTFELSSNLVVTGGASVSISSDPIQRATLDAQGERTIFQVSLYSNLTLHNICLVNGRHGNQAGALLCLTSKVTLRSCRISNCTSVFGGALMVRTAEGVITLTEGTEISDCWASEAGGAMAIAQGATFRMESGSYIHACRSPSAGGVSVQATPLPPLTT